VSRAAVLCTLVLAGCAVPPPDSFAAAERALRRADLLRALELYDAVPVGHTRYPEARAVALELEARMRRCHELIVDALMLRSEGRDAEAVETLRRAQRHWPTEPSVERWIHVVEQRLSQAGRRHALRRPPRSGSVAMTSPGRRPAVPAGEVAVAIEGEVDGAVAVSPPVVTP
jgi:hypothetical protein